MMTRMAKIVVGGLLGMAASALAATVQVDLVPCILSSPDIVSGFILLVSLLVLWFACLPRLCLCTLLFLLHGDTQISSLLPIAAAAAAAVLAAFLRSTGTANEADGIPQCVL